MENQIIVKGREAQRKVAERNLAVAQELVDSLAAAEAAENPPATPKPPQVCVFCGSTLKAWGDRGTFGIQSTISGKSVLCHNQTAQPGEGCWQLYQRAKATVLPHCKVGPKRHNKALGDKLLIEEVARLLTMPKHQGNIAAQFEPTYHLTAKTGEQVRLDKIENELKELRQRLRGGQTGNELSQAADLAAATKAVDEREASRYVDEDIEFGDTPVRAENYDGEHATENER